MLTPVHMASSRQNGLYKFKLH